MDRVEVVPGTGEVTTTMTHYLRMRISWLLTRTANQTQLISYMTVQKKGVNLKQTSHKTHTVPKPRSSHEIRDKALGLSHPRNSQIRVTNKDNMTVDCEHMVSYCVPGNNTSGRGKIGSSMGFSVWISSAAVHLKTFLLFRFAFFCGDKEILTILSNLHKPNSLTLVCPLLLLVVTATNDDEEKHVQPDEDEDEDEDMLSDGFELWPRSGEVKWEDVVARHDEVRAGTCESWVEDTMVYIEVCKNQAECKLIRIIAFQLPYSIQEFEATRRKLHLEHNPTCTLELTIFPYSQQLPYYLHTKPTKSEFAPNLWARKDQVPRKTKTMEYDNKKQELDDLDRAFEWPYLLAQCLLGNWSYKEKFADGGYPT